MKLALIGYGRMGREVERAALATGHEVLERVDPSADGATAPDAASADLSRVDCLVDFSRADGVLDNIRAACRAKKPIVVGTTAWGDRLDEAIALVAEAGIGLIHAPNFAIGVQTLFHLVAEAARLLDRLAEAPDAAVHEIHHRGKADAPSGTARRLAAILLHHLEHKTDILTETPKRPVSPGELLVSSQRFGAAPGTHVVSFDLGAETLELRHEARGRAIFARGAVTAAEWIVGRTGVHQFGDLLFEQ